MNPIPAPLAIVGEGYTIEVTLSAEALKNKLLRAAVPVLTVEDDEQKKAAHAVLLALADFRIKLEKSRKEVKTPVLKICADIDSKAQVFGGAVEAQERRINALLAGYATRQEQERRRLAEEAREAQEEADRKRREAEELQRKAERSKTLATAAVATKAAAVATEQANLFEEKGTEILAAAPPAQKFVLDYDIHSISELYASKPYLVVLTPRRADILAEINAGREENPNFTLPGITIKEVPKISTR